MGDASWLHRLAAVCAAAALAGCTQPDDPGAGGDAADAPDRDAVDVRDYLDLPPCSSLTDADGDTIADPFESAADGDGDTVPNDRDDDSDGDGIPDREEAGNGGNLCEYPRDSDGDTVIDALDTDSDNDGLGDGEEHERWGTDPLQADSDGDTVTDLAETAYGSDPRDSGSTVDPEDYFVVLPYRGSQVVRELDFGTDLQTADVYFLLDSTSSMSDAISNVVSSLSLTIVPGLLAAIPDVELGVGAFNDFNYCPPGGGLLGCYGICMGTLCDAPFWHFLDVTSDETAVREGLQQVLSNPRGNGADEAESYVPALWVAATGNGLTAMAASVPPKACEDPTRAVGYPCFRAGSLPIMVMVGDAPWHNGPDGAWPYEQPTATFDDAVDAMLDIGARFVGVHIPRYSTEGQEHHNRMALATGSVDGAGNPLVALSSDGTVSSDIIDMIDTLASSTPQDVSTVTEDDPGDEYGVDAREFILSILPLRADPPDGAASRDDREFFDVRPGTSVAFRITFENTFFPPREMAAVFKARIVVIGNRVARLDERIVIIIVPPIGEWVDII